MLNEKELPIILYIRNSFFILMLIFLKPGAGYAIDAFSYKKIKTEQNQIIHVIEIDPDKYNIITSHASELGKAKTQVYKMAKHHNAVIGINGGFFRFNKNNIYAVPAGVLKVDDKWQGIAYRPRAAIGWSNKNNQALIDIIQTNTYVNINGNKYKIRNFNPLNEYKVNAVFSHEQLNSYKDNKCNLKITRNVITNVNFEIEEIKEYEYVFALEQKNCPLDKNLIGKKAELVVDIHPLKSPKTAQKWQNFENIVGGAPLLIYQGKINYNYKNEIKNKKFITSANARTAIGLLKNNHWVLVVVEQNKLLNIVGMKIKELADFMHDLGCYYALNLDGGVSSSLYISSEVENLFPDNFIEFGLFQMRPVTDAILIVPK